MPRFDARPCRPLTVARPLCTFGKRFVVFVTTGVTFSPQTLLRAVVDEPSGQRPSARRDSSSKSYVASARGVRPASNAMRKRYRAEIKRGVAEKDLDLVADACLRGQAPLTLERPRSVWHGWAHELVADQEISAVCRLAAMFDDWAQLADDRTLQGAEHEVVADTVRFMVGSPPSTLTALLPPSAFMAIESALLVLCEYEHFFRHESEARDEPASLFESALAEGATPIGNWLGAAQRALGRSSLAATADLALLRNLAIRGRRITEAQLKSWSSGRKRMPSAAARQLVEQLTGINRGGRITALVHHFYVAQLAMFLCDVCQACTFTTITWAEAQAQLLARYTVLRKEDN